MKMERMLELCKALGRERPEHCNNTGGRESHQNLFSETPSRWILFVSRDLFYGVERPLVS
jgi:hypothetical protein